VLRNARGWCKDKKNKCDFYPEFKISYTLNLAYFCHLKLLYKCYFHHVAALVELAVIAQNSLTQGFLNFNRTLRRNCCFLMASKKQKHEHRLIDVMYQGTS